LIITISCVVQHLKTIINTMRSVDSKHAKKRKTEYVDNNGDTSGEIGKKAKSDTLQKNLQQLDQFADQYFKNLNVDYEIIKNYGEGLIEIEIDIEEFYKLPYKELNIAPFEMIEKMADRWMEKHPEFNDLQHDINLKDHILFGDPVVVCFKYDHTPDNES
jgi:hypothetical protein